MKKILLGFAVVGMLFSACQKEDQIIKNDFNNIEVQTLDQIVPGQYVVVLKPSTNKAFTQLKYSEKIHRPNIWVFQDVYDRMLTSVGNANYIDD